MPAKTGEILQSLAAIPGLQVATNEPLSRHTRFGIGGPAAILAESPRIESFVAAVAVARRSGLPMAVIGAGSNLIVSDAGFDGIVLRFTAEKIAADGNSVTAEAGAELQALVDFTIERGLGGLETLTRIPGSVGAAIYGNAGAYGRSISDSVVSVTILDAESLRSLGSPECEFSYRESVFKRRRGWLIVSTSLGLRPADRDELRRSASEIERIRDEKFPPTMKCAGSVFKNLRLAELPATVARQVPAAVVREGKVPAAWFLEQVGAKGVSQGAIRVADYHANLIYNTGGGTASELCALIDELKSRVRGRFGFDLEEEVQYLGFSEGERNSPLS